MNNKLVKKSYRELAEEISKALSRYPTDILKKMMRKEKTNTDIDLLLAKEYYAADEIDALLLIKK